MSPLRILICQTDILWEAPSENRKRIRNAIDRFMVDYAKDSLPDMFLLPEFFATGFTMNTSVAEPDYSSPTQKWMVDIGREYGFATCGSIPTTTGKGIVNRFLFIHPDGKTDHYDKRHLFRMSGEDISYISGNTRKTVEYRGWNIGLNICYDLRFPVWSRNGADNAYDMMLNVASWPASRYEAASILVKARAIENLSYYVFVNRTGISPDTEYGGGSFVSDYKGRSISTTVAVIDGCTFIGAEADLDSLRAFRKKFPAWKDADKYEIL